MLLILRELILILLLTQSKAEDTYPLQNNKNTYSFEVVDIWKGIAESSWDSSKFWAELIIVHF